MVVGDNAWTFFCGTPSVADKGLCEVTRDCLKAGIEAAVAGNRIGDIGHAVQSLAEANGYSVVRDYVGHGVGRAMHENTIAITEDGPVILTQDQDGPWCAMAGGTAEQA